MEVTEIANKVPIPQADTSLIHDLQTNYFKQPETLK
jgi:hypothetical protein